MSLQVLYVVGLLAVSNLFMTFAWYGHLNYAEKRPLMVAILVSWGIAFFEYLITVPTNRYAFRFLELFQMKLLQEVVTLAVFVPFAILYMGDKLRLNHLWSALCLVGAVYFAFRK